LGPSTRISWARSEHLQVSEAGTHPDNREKAMLVPIDVHDLLLKFADKGYNPSKWDALALRTPAGPESDQWQQPMLPWLGGSPSLEMPQKNIKAEGAIQQLPSAWHSSLAHAASTLSLQIRMGRCQRLSC
jgi:hypothetical protein